MSSIYRVVIDASISYRIVSLHTENFDVYMPNHHPKNLEIVFLNMRKTGRRKLWDKTDHAKYCECFCHCQKLTQLF